MPLLLSPFLLPLVALINITPDPVAIQLGPIPILWYGVCYAVGLAATYWVITREARRRRLSRSAVARAALEAGLGQPGPDFASEARRQSLLASRRRSRAEDAFWLRVADATGWK